MARKISAKRIVLKIGTSTLTKKDGTLNTEFIDRLAAELSSLIKSGKSFVIVTSGAVGAGCGELKLRGKIRDPLMKRAAAAIGQSILMQQYRNAFSKHGISCGQILYMYDDVSDRSRYLNLQNTLNTLLRIGAVPIINENDPISIKELGLSFGDNDKLSALVASKIEADMLIILSDIEGLYDKDPKQNADSRLVSEVDQITPKIESMCGSQGSALAVGGMLSKINAVKICNKAGIAVVICNGSLPIVITRVLEGNDIGTIFRSKEKMASKKRWILNANPSGKILVDDGAKKALMSGKNLLPAGITRIIGSFASGEIVDISTGESEDSVFAKALSDYSSDELLAIKGKKSAEIMKILGKKAENVTRKENLAMIE